MKVVKKGARKVYSSKRIRANEEFEEEVDAPVAEAELEVDPSATELVFEAEDVAELLAEATGEEVSVTVDEDAVVFAVGEDEFTVQPEGDEEIMEATRKVLKGKKPVAASKKVARPAKKPAARPIKRR